MQKIVMKIEKRIANAISFVINGNKTFLVEIFLFSYEKKAYMLLCNLLKLFKGDLYRQKNEI